MTRRRLFAWISGSAIAIALAGCGPAETPATAPAFDNPKAGAVTQPVKGSKPKPGFE